MKFCERCGKELLTRTLEGRERLACQDSACGFIRYDEDYKRVPKAKLRPWPFGTGLVVEKWLAARSS